MTEKEIINTLRMTISKVEWNYPLDYTVALEEAIKLIRLQIKQPLKELRGTKPIELGNDYAECPNCGEWLEKKKLARYRYNHCPKCGQALDWRERDEEMTEHLSIDEIIGHCERIVVALEDIFGKEKIAQMPIQDGAIAKKYWGYKQVAAYLRELKAIREYVDGLRTFDQHNEYIDKIKEIAK